MEFKSLEAALLQYWPYLTQEQQHSVLRIVRSIVEPHQPISVEEYNREIDEANARVQAGDFYTHEQVEALSKNW